MLSFTAHGSMLITGNVKESLYVMPCSSKTVSSISVVVFPLMVHNKSSVSLENIHVNLTMSPFRLALSPSGIIYGRDTSEYREI